MSEERQAPPRDTAAGNSDAAAGNETGGQTPPAGGAQRPAAGNPVESAVNQAGTQVQAAADRAEAQVQNTVTQAETAVQNAVNDVTAQASAAAAAAAAQATDMVNVVAQQAMATINVVFQVFSMVDIGALEAQFDAVFGALEGYIEGAFGMADGAIDDAAGAADGAIDATFTALDQGYAKVAQAANSMQDVMNRARNLGAGLTEDVNETFTKLRGKMTDVMGGFFKGRKSGIVPQAIIYVDGSRLSVEKEASLESVVVVDRMDAPSTFVITLGDSERKWLDDEELFIGGSVKIKMGYKDALDTLMDKGDITMFGANFRQNQSTQIICKGHCRMWRLNRGRKTKSHGVPLPFVSIKLTESDVIRIIALKNGFIPIVDYFGTPRVFHLQKNLSDYDYIVEMTKKFNRRLAVDGRMLFALPMIPKIDPGCMVEWGKTLKEFRATLSQRGIITECEVRGVNRRTHATVSSTCTHNQVIFRIGGFRLGAALGEEAYGPAKAIIHDYDVQDMNSADSLARAYLTEHSMEYIRAECRCQGNPSIRAGFMVMIKGVGDKFSGLYYIMQARHEINPYFGYETEFDAVKNTTNQLIPKLDVLAKGLLGKIADQAGAGGVLAQVGNVVKQAQEVMDTVNEAMEKVKEFKDILEEARRRAKETVDGVKKQVKEKLHDVKKQIDTYKKQIKDTVDKVKEAARTIQKAQGAIQKKIQAAQALANAQIGRLQGTVATTQGRIESVQADVQRQIDEAVAKNLPQEEIDRAKQEAEQQLQQYKAQYDEMNAKLQAMRAQAEAQIQQMTQAFMSQFNEAKAIYDDARAQIDAAINAVKNIEKKLRAALQKLEEEAKKILMEVVDNFINEAQSQVMAAIPDVDKMEAVALGARRILQRNVQDALPRLKQVVEDVIEDLTAEFKAIVVNAKSLFERVKGAIGNIILKIKSLLGGADNLKWLKEGVEVEEAMVGETVTMHAKLEEIPDDTEFKVSIYEKDFIGDDDFIKDFTVKAKDNALDLSWEMIYTDDSDEVIVGMWEQMTKGYTLPEYVFRIENSEKGIKQESGKLGCKDWHEIECKDWEGNPRADVEYVLKLPDGSERRGKTNQNGFALEENVPPGPIQVTLNGKVINCSKVGNEKRGS